MLNSEFPSDKNRELRIEHWSDSVRFSFLVAPHHWHKLLDSFVLLYFSGVDVPFRVHCDCVDPVKLAGVGAVPTESSECLSCVAIEDPHFVVRSVGYVEVLLLRVTR